MQVDDSATQAPFGTFIELAEHTSEVFMCAWNPVFTNYVATGSGDATARIWVMVRDMKIQICGLDEILTPLAPPFAHTHTHTQSGKSASTGSTPTGYSEIHLLKHGTHAGDKNKDVTTLEWSPTGLLLATGSYDGVARVWDRAGKLVFTLQQHKGPIFSLKWNKRGNYILSGSYDKTTIVWDAVTGSIQQMFEIHSQPALDVDWRDDDIFASCSTDKRVVVCKVGGGTNNALEVFSGHVDEVNAVKWDPSGTLLASCSDDGTAKIWKPTKLKLGVGAADSVSTTTAAAAAANNCTTAPTPPFRDLTLHENKVLTCEWSPCGPGSANPSSSLLLATASFDATVRLWEVQNGSCLRVLSRHTDPVYSVSFSPNGMYLASGSLAGKLYVWDVAKGDLKRSFTGQGEILKVDWDDLGSHVIAIFALGDSVVVSYDSRRFEQYPAAFNKILSAPPSIPDGRLLLDVCHQPPSEENQFYNTLKETNYNILVIYDLIPVLLPALQAEAVLAGRLKPGAKTR